MRLSRHTIRQILFKCCEYNFPFELHSNSLGLLPHKLLRTSKLCRILLLRHLAVIG